jgi:hypothetical protein
LHFCTQASSLDEQLDKPVDISFLVARSGAACSATGPSVINLMNNKEDYNGLPNCET